MMRIGLDTNILLRLSYPTAPKHLETMRAVYLLAESEYSLCCTPQNLVEFWNVSTRPIAANGFALTPAQTNDKITILQEVIELLSDHIGLFDLWRENVLRYSVLGKQVHDAKLASALQSHQVTRLLTWDVGDFRRYSFLTFVTPEQVLAGALP